MVDSPRSPDPKPHARPRWLKVSLIVTTVVVLLVVVVALVAGGGHGPSRHLPGDDSPGGHTPPVQHSP
jgi:hypothetical protein